MRMSLIIATADRAESLARVLRDLADCRLPGEGLHVVVADNGTPEETARVCRRPIPGLRVEHLVVERRGKSLALNRAIEATSADLLVFTDDDVEFDRSWLAEFRRAAADWPDCLLFGGRVVPVWPGDLPARLRGSRYLGVLYARFDLDQGEGPTRQRPAGPAMAVRRRAFEAGVRYDEKRGPGEETVVPMGEDTDIARQLASRGTEPVYVPSSVVYHRVRREQLALRWQLARGVRYGRSQAYGERIPRGAWSVAGAPLWLYREVVGGLLASAWNAVQGRRRDSFDRLMDAAVSLGRAMEARRTGGRAA